MPNSAPPIPPPSITVVVPATDRPPTLDRCVAAIEAGDEPPDELCVVDDPAGAGPAEARNRGARRAVGEVLLFVDSDVAIHPDAVGRIRAAFAHDPALTAVFGAYDDDPAAPGTVSRFRNLLHHHVHVTSPGRASTFWAGIGAVRREAFLESGGFDARRYPRPAVEDIELGSRLCAAGARIELDPRIRGTHLKAWTLGETVATDFARRGVPWARLQLETRRLSGALNLGWRNRASAAAVALACAATLARRPTPAVSAAAALVTLNRSLYALLARRGGARLAVAGVGLHALHHVTAIASVPAAIALHLAARRWGPGGAR
jgi:cellulose synthase/poly-beta-1,6-N-acetylglucosamine synthase-like glycosyltransferase